MKQIASNYSIAGSAVTLTGVNVPLSQVLLVSNATTGQVLYSMAGPAAVSYTQAANSVLTLASAPGATDKLTIFYDDGVAVNNAPSTVAVSNFPATQPVSGSVSVSNFPATQPVSGTVTADTGLSQPLTDSQLRASAVPVSGTVNVSGTVPVSGPLTDTELRASAVPVSGTVTANVTFPATQPVSGSVSVSNFPATQPVSGTVGISGTVPVSGTFWQTTQPVSGPLTDTQLRATAVPVSGTVTANTGLTQPLTDTQLRASAVGVTLPNATTSALTTFTSTTSAQILASSSSRRGVVLSSPSTNTGICYVVLGTSTASATACSFLVNPGDVINITGVTTALTGIWSAASQTLFVTDLT